MDITSFITWFIEAMINIFKDLFGMLSQVQFMGVTLFEFMISAFMMGSLITIVLAVARNSANKITRLVINAEKRREK